MRVIAGKYKSRVLSSARDLDIRPVMDRVKTFIFDILSVKVCGARVCDLFAGSGSLGIEALSRGAEKVDFVDVSGRALSLIRRNLESLGANEAHSLIRSDALRFVEGATASYDVLFCDPPYRYLLVVEVVLKILASPMLAPGGILVVEHAAGLKWGQESTAPVPFRVKEFGRTMISLFKVAEVER